MPNFLFQPIFLAKKWIFCRYLNILKDIKEIGAHFIIPIYRLENLTSPIFFRYSINASVSLYTVCVCEGNIYDHNHIPKVHQYYKYIMYEASYVCMYVCIYMYVKVQQCQCQCQCYVCVYTLCKVKKKKKENKKISHFDSSFLFLKVLCIQVQRLSKTGLLCMCKRPLQT